MNHIKCADCRYTRIDTASSDKKWTAYECNNPDSDYYKALLNVTQGGGKQKTITWEGCEYGREW